MPPQKDDNYQDDFNFTFILKDAHGASIRAELDATSAQRAASAVSDALHRMTAEDKAERAILMLHLAAPLPRHAASARPKCRQPGHGAAHAEDAFLARAYRR